MDKPECVLCRFWDSENMETGLCRRYMPVRVTGHEGLWPTTRATDWCHFFSQVGGIQGGRGSKLTNAEILSAVEKLGAIATDDLVEKIEINGLSATMARQRIGKLVAAGCLAEQEGELTVTSVPLETLRRKPPGRTPEHTLEVFRDALARVATPENPSGYNRLFAAANEVASIGKSAFNRILQDGVAAGKVLQYQTGQFTGKYYLETEIDPP